MTAWHWTSIVPSIYIISSITGYAVLLYLTYSNCHLRVFAFPKISHLGAQQPESQYFAFVSITQATSFCFMVHYSYQIWKLLMKKNELAKLTMILGMVTAA